MKKIVLIFIVVFLGCKKKDTDIIYAGAIGIFFQNAKGENLLGSNSVGVLIATEFLYL